MDNSDEINNTVSEENKTDTAQTNTEPAEINSAETKTETEEHRTENQAPVQKSANADSPKRNGYSNSNENGAGYQPMDHVVRARLAIIRENTKTGWKRLLTVTQWGGGKFKLDVRDWNPEMTRATKGMTFTRSEAMKLRDVLAVLDLNIIDDYQQNEERPKNSETMLKAS